MLTPRPTRSSCWLTTGRRRTRNAAALAILAAVGLVGLHTLQPAINPSTASANQGAPLAHDVRLVVALRASLNDPSSFARAAGARYVRQLGSPLYLLLATADKTRSLSRLRADRRVLAAEQDRGLSPLDLWTNDPFSRLQWALPASSSDFIPGNGERYDEVHPVGVDALGAWSQTTGSGVIVAVLDTGFDVSQPDLAGQFWTNPAEVAGNGVDDDHNGIVDDVYGADFFDHSGELGSYETHGTSVASVIAARTNNGVGMAGIAPDARVMALRTANGQGETVLAAAVEAIEYAIKHGAKVINLSWGSAGTCSAILSRAFKDADARGVLIVAAAGNEELDLDHSVPYCPHLHAPNEIVVAATNQRSTLSWFSNYGATTVEIAAPGELIVVAQPASERSAYVQSSGTSFAAPIAAGVAALAYAVRPSASAETIREALIRGSTPLSALQGKVVSGGVVNAVGTLQILSGLQDRIRPINPSDSSGKFGGKHTRKKKVVHKRPKRNSHK